MCGGFNYHAIPSLHASLSLPTVKCEVVSCNSSHAPSRLKTRFPQSYIGAPPLHAGAASSPASSAPVSVSSQTTWQDTCTQGCSSRFPRSYLSAPPLHAGAASSPASSAPVSVSSQTTWQDTCTQGCSSYSRRCISCASHVAYSSEREV